MKRWLRQALLVLLSITLPVYGWASVSLMSPCPMQSEQVGKHSAPCCQDMDPMKPGKPCKAGQECQTGALYQAVVASVEPIIPQTQRVIALPTAQWVSNAASAVWRPPRLS